MTLVLTESHRRPIVPRPTLLSPTQVSRNFSNLGNFLNTRLGPKSGASANVSSTGLAATSSSARLPGTGYRRGSRTAASGNKADATPSALGKSLGPPSSPDFISGAVSAVYHSVSPAGRRSRDLAASEAAGGGGGTPSPGSGGRRLRGWNGPKRPLSLRALLSPGHQKSPVGEEGRFEAAEDGPHHDVGTVPITIGTAAAAAAAAAEGASGQSFSDTDPMGKGFSRIPDGGAAARSKAEERDAKLLLFGRQLGGGWAGGGTGGARGGAGAGGGGSTGGGQGKSLLSMGLPQSIKRLTFPGKKQAGKKTGQAEARIQEDKSS